MYIGVFCFYAIVIGICLLFAHIILIGHLAGNAVEITKDQLPEVHKIIENQSQIPTRRWDFEWLCHKIFRDQLCGSLF